MIPYFKYNDVELFYIKEGKGQPLLLISGLGSKMSWIFQIPFFKERMMVITPHNRGVGKSSRPNYPYTMDMYLTDIKELLKHLNIKEKIHLCGLSMGGMIALNFILKYPDIVKTLILCATTSYHPVTAGNSIIESQKLMENFNLDQKFKVRIAALYSRPFQKKLKSNKELFKKIRKNFIEDPTRLQDWINQGAALKNHDTRDSLHKIQQPTLILVGDEDKIIVGLEHSKLLHEKIPNSKLEVYKNVGHRFVDEIPEEVNSIIWDFIQENS
ncbi:MAG: alpha/beta fold hydrolase [Promethearchaeota archaeon]